MQEEAWLLYIPPQGQVPGRFVGDSSTIEGVGQMLADEAQSRGEALRGVAIKGIVIVRPEDTSDTNDLPEFYGV